MDLRGRIRRCGGLGKDGFFFGLFEFEVELFSRWLVKLEVGIGVGV